MISMSCVDAALQLDGGWRRVGLSCSYSACDALEITGWFCHSISLRFGERSVADVASQRGRPLIRHCGEGLCVGEWQPCRCSSWQYGFEELYCHSWVLQWVLGGCLVDGCGLPESVKWLVSVASRPEMCESYSSCATSSPTISGEDGNSGDGKTSSGRFSTAAEEGCSDANAAVI